jgi:trans-2,3-dihydro-3-hydroxyanthranilate isomerase
VSDAQTDLAGATGREAGVATEQLVRDLRAVRLVPDDRDRPLLGGQRRPDVVRVGARREALVDANVGTEPVGDRVCGLPRAHEWAGEHERRRRCVRCHPLGERSRFVPAAFAQLPELVRVARVRVGVTNEKKQHSGENTPMPTLRYVVADVFTETPLAGNQLAVFTDARDLDEGTMQALALEVGFSESVFVLPAERDGDVRIRIFTPRVELRFAGHPILGSAFALGGPLQRSLLRLETGSGTVPVELERDESGAIVFGRMSQPVPTVEPYPDAEGLLAALGVERSLLPVERYDNGVQPTYVLLPSEGDVAALRPDLAALAELEVMASCSAGTGTVWKTRMFAPYGGVPEDPATGSAAGPLACHLCRHGLVPWGTEIEITQGVELGRPSKLYARAHGRDGTVESVEVGGRAVVVARGEYRI